MQPFPITVVVAPHQRVSFLERSSEKHLSEKSVSSAARPRAYCFREGLADLLRTYPFGRQGSPDALIALASALTSGPLWQSLDGAVLVVRFDPEPVLAIVGHFDDASNARMQFLGSQIENAVGRLRYVGYAQAEKDCELLAQKLIDRFGTDEISRASFYAIPRGGLLVLGMLSYMLGLGPEQIQPRERSDGIQIVVDDCSLSGARFQTFLKDFSAPRVVFAHLYSHPDLRESIERRESTVVACIAAHDLFDHAPERLGERHPAYREMWMQRSNEQCYWIGQPDHLSFPWTEPDATYWNPVTEQEEPGWRLVPPAHCLKNRGAGHDAVQVLPPAEGPIRPAPHVLYADLDGELIIVDAERKTSFALDAVAAEFWRSIVANGDREAIAANLEDLYDITADQLRADVNRFIDDLLDRKILILSDHDGRCASDRKAS